VACTQARISYNKAYVMELGYTVVACTQARISYNTGTFTGSALYVVACTQARISYNFTAKREDSDRVVACTQARISYNVSIFGVEFGRLWLALRLGSVTMSAGTIYPQPCCGLHSGSDQLQYTYYGTPVIQCCGLHSGSDQLQSV